MIHLGFDPGETTGIAILEDGIPREFLEVSQDELVRWLRDHRNPGPNPHNYEHATMEEYYIRPPGKGGFNHTWGKVPTLRVIGAISFWCWEEHIPLTMQDSAILTPAAGRYGMPHPKSKSLPQRNAVSAVLHGRWWYDGRPGSR